VRPCARKIRLIRFLNDGRCCELRSESAILFQVFFDHDPRCLVAIAYALIDKTTKILTSLTIL
jgi:hypothetical protein